MRVTSYLIWDEYLRLLSELSGDKLRLVFAIQGYCGLRVGDVLNLTWGDIIETRELSIVEQKTGKTRVIYFNESLVSIINEEYIAQDPHIYVFRSKFANKPMSTEYVNRRLKEIFEKFNVDYSGNISSHLFRKTFGRRVMDKDNWSDKALLMLNEIYGHSTIKLTKIYLGIRQEEIKNIYHSLA
jgi:integrase